MDDTKPTDSVDKLVAKASELGNADDLTKLWKAFLNLKQWHLITKYKENIDDCKPFIGIIDNQPWVFLFSDRQKATQYCLNEKNTGFTDPQGGVYIISMETDNAIIYIIVLHLKGVYGMRINEGNGWFSPIENLNAIIEYVKKTN